MLPFVNKTGSLRLVKYVTSIYLFQQCHLLTTYLLGQHLLHLRRNTRHTYFILRYYDQYFKYKAIVKVLGDMMQSLIR